MEKLGGNVIENGAKDELREGMADDYLKDKFKEYDIDIPILDIPIEIDGEDKKINLESDIPRENDLDEIIRLEDLDSREDDPIYNEVSTLDKLRDGRIDDYLKDEFKEYDIDIPIVDIPRENDLGEIMRPKVEYSREGDSTSNEISTLEKNADNIKDNEINNREYDEEYKMDLKEKTEWSDEIIEEIKSVEEAENYKNAELEEVEINGKKCLVKDLEMDKPVDPMGRTNKERMEQGLSPIDKNGEKVELHHIGQKKDGSLVELNQSEHRGKGNDGILHDKTKESEIDRNEFNKEKSEHWKERSGGNN